MKMLEVGPWAQFSVPCSGAFTSRSDLGKNSWSVSLGGLWQPVPHVHDQKLTEVETWPWDFCTQFREGVGGKGLQD